jgi:hypothetical protein
MWMMHGLRLIKSLRTLWWATTRACVVSKASYTWAVKWRVSDATSLAFGMPSAGRRNQNVKTMKVSVCCRLPGHILFNRKLDISSLCGKDVLPAIVRSSLPEYETLTKEQKDELLAEFEEHKASKTTGLRITMKSPVNNVTHTLKSIENEVLSFYIHHILAFLTFRPVKQFAITHWS